MCILDNVLQFMHQKKVSQKEICTYIGVSQQNFTNWKLGLNESYKKYLPQMAEYLNVSVEQLTGKTIVNKKEITDEDIKHILFEGEENITDDMLEEVKRYAKYVVSERKNKK